MSAIDTKYGKLGGTKGFLGSPTQPEKSCPDGIGRYRHYQNGSIYWHPLAGAHEIHGLIRAKWAKLGWEKSVLGYPKTDESTSAAGGRYNQFQGGTILWKTGAKEAFETHGAIRSKWGSLGWESGALGFPVTDETKTPDGIGRFNHFENGSIYWKPTISAHEVHGLIRKLWAEKGWEKNTALGYPISDELPASPGSANRYGDFEDGVVYWRSGKSKASVLSKMVLGGASKNAADVLAEINKITLPLILKKVDGRKIYKKSDPILAGPEPLGSVSSVTELVKPVTDYRWDGSRVRNRWYKWRISLGIEISGTADIAVTLDLRIEVALDDAKKAVIASPREWWAHVNVPWPTSMGISAKEVLAKLKPEIDPHMHKVHVVAKIPKGVNVLAVKVQRNGNLDVFMEPLA
jgi:hypothetical protein